MHWFRLGQAEFASRIGVAPEELAAYLDGSASPSASLMIRMRRLSDRFVKVKAERWAESTRPVSVSQREFKGQLRPTPASRRPA